MIAVLGAIVPASLAQCPPQWQPFDPSTASVPGTDGSVYATTMWDPDGPGPQTPKLVVGGHFSIAGNALANNIALHDPVTGEWSPLGTGMSYAVLSLAVLPNGDVVAGGQSTSAGGVNANYVARWDGLSWLPLGTGTDSTVSALAVLPSGELVAGGYFQTAGGVSASRVALWDGTMWSPLGVGMDHAVSAPATLTVAGSSCSADWNADAAVNSNDISAFLTAWLDTVQSGC